MFVFLNFLKQVKVEIQDILVFDILRFCFILLYIPCFITLFQTIIFIRDKNARGQEISGYIDYAHRMKTEEFEPYFAGKKRLLPRPSDLR